MKRSLRSAQTLCALITITLGAIDSTSLAAVELQPSRFYEAYQSKFGNATGDETTPEILNLINTVEDIGTINGFTATSGGGLPRSETRFSLGIEDGRTLFSPWGVSASAEIRYYWAIEQIGGIPWGESVPVVIDTRGAAGYTIDSVHGPGIANLYASAFFDNAGEGSRTYSVFPCDGSCVPGVQTFRETFTADVTPNLASRVQLTSVVWFNLFSGSMEASAWVDPIIQISPDFERRDDFQVVYSNFVTAVPLPLPIAMLAPALLALASLSRRRKAVHHRG